MNHKQSERYSFYFFYIYFQFYILAFINQNHNYKRRLKIWGLMQFLMYRDLIGLQIPFPKHKYREVLSKLELLLISIYQNYDNTKTILSKLL